MGLPGQAHSGSEGGPPGILGRRVQVRLRGSGTRMRFEQGQPDASVSKFELCELAGRVKSHPKTKSRCPHRDFEPIYPNKNWGPRRIIEDGVLSLLLRWPDDDFSLEVHHGAAASPLPGRRARGLWTARLG